jgi:integral membrane protein
MTAPAGPEESSARAATRTWFFAVGRAEALSFLLLLGIGMPLKYAAGLPGANAWIGWLHGMLLLVYLSAAAAVVRLFGLGLRHWAVAAALSLLPLGPVLLEARWRRRGLLAEEPAAG